MGFLSGLKAIKMIKITNSVVVSEADLFSVYVLYCYLIGSPLRAKNVYSLCRESLAKFTPIMTNTNDFHEKVGRVCGRSALYHTTKTKLTCNFQNF